MNRIFCPKALLSLMVICLFALPACRWNRDCDDDCAPRCEKRCSKPCKKRCEMPCKKSCKKACPVRYEDEDDMDYDYNGK